MGGDSQKCSAVGPTVRSGTDCSNKWQLMKKMQREMLLSEKYFIKTCFQLKFQLVFFLRSQINIYRI